MEGNSLNTELKIVFKKPSKILNISLEHLEGDSNFI